MNGKILPENILTNFDMMYRDSPHDPSSSYKYQLFGGLHFRLMGCRDCHPHQVWRPTDTKGPVAQWTLMCDIYAHNKSMYYQAGDKSSERRGLAWIRAYLNIS